MLTHRYCSRGVPGAAHLPCPSPGPRGDAENSQTHRGTYTQLDTAYPYLQATPISLETKAVQSTRLSICILIQVRRETYGYVCIIVFISFCSHRNNPNRAGDRGGISFEDIPFVREKWAVE